MRKGPVPEEDWDKVANRAVQLFNEAKTRSRGNPAMQDCAARALMKSMWEPSEVNIELITKVLAKRSAYVRKNRARKFQPTPMINQNGQLLLFQIAPVIKLRRKQRTVLAWFRK